MIYIYHNINDMASLAGMYDGTSWILTNVSETTFTDYAYELPFVHTEVLLTLYLHVLPLSFLSFIFNTILLVLYIIFHNEPNVKSTSVSLSMLIFTGCYFLVSFNLVLTLNRQYILGL